MKNSYIPIIWTERSGHPIAADDQGFGVIKPTPDHNLAEGARVI